MWFHLSQSSLYLLQTTEQKTDHLWQTLQCIFGPKASKCYFKIISFPSLDSELSFDLEDFEISFNWAQLSTKNSLYFKKDLLKRNWNTSGTMKKNSLLTSCLHIRNGKPDTISGSTSKWKALIATFAVSSQASFRNSYIFFLARMYL